MTTSIARYSAFIAAAALFAAGCGGSSSDSSTSSASAAPTATAMAPGDVKMMAAAPIPSDLKCTDAIVWVNLSSKAYHMSGDKYYGRAKHGEYECLSMAESKGYHLAGTPHHHTGQPSPSST